MLLCERIYKNTQYKWNYFDIWHTHPITHTPRRFQQILIINNTQSCNKNVSNNEGRAAREETSGVNYEHKAVIPC